MRKKLSKILLTDVAEQIKPVYKTNCSRKKNFDRRTQASVPKKVFANRETPPYQTYIGDSIDQGAMRLGGL